MHTIHGGRLAVFLAATLGLTWGAARVTMLRGGNEAFLQPGLPPLGMLFPAFVAILIEWVTIRNRKPPLPVDIQGPGLVRISFLGLTVIAGMIHALALFTEIKADGLQLAGSILFVLWTLSLIRLYRKHGEGPFRKVGLQLGNIDQGVRFVIGVVAFFLLQAGLNLAFGLGAFQGIQPSIEGIPIPSGYYPLALVSFLALGVTGTPLGGLAATFGEEYGWRGFLQRELRPLGLRLGSFLIGLIWAIWHIPIIQSGVHTYPPTTLGYICSFVFFILWGFVQSYAVIKTGSVWTAAFLHGVVNSVYAFTLNYLVRPQDKLFSFGLGIYGLVCLGIIVFLILRDPAWKGPARGKEEEGWHFQSFSPSQLG